jgi:transcriptional regulator PpsR
LSKLPKEIADLSALSVHAPELADMLVSVASDIALVIGHGGVIERVALGGSEPVKAIADQWVGRHWSDTVTGDTRRKVEQLLAEVADGGVSRVRQVNHPSPPGLDIPIAYSAVRLGQHGPLLAVGRDMSVVSAMQQRLVHAQQEMERDYWHRRQVETRYQLIFQVAHEPVLVVDSEKFCIIDANRAAGRLIGLSPEQLVGRKASSGFGADAQPKIEQLLSSVRDEERSIEEEVWLADRGLRLRVSAMPFRSEASSVLLIRLHELDALWETGAGGEMLTGLMGCSPDAIVVTDSRGILNIANPAFLRLVQLSAEQQVRGRSMSEWVDNFGEILRQTRTQGRIALLGAVMHGALGRALNVEMSAAFIVEHAGESFGFIIRVRNHAELDQPSNSGGFDRAVH